MLFLSFRFSPSLLLIFFSENVTLNGFLCSMGKIFAVISDIMLYSFLCQCYLIFYRLPVKFCIFLPLENIWLKFSPLHLPKQNNLGLVWGLSDWGAITAHLVICRIQQQILLPENLEKNYWMGCRAGGKLAIKNFGMENRIINAKKMQHLELWSSSCFKVPECWEAPLTMTSEKAATYYICLRGIYYLYLGMHRSWACYDLSYICHPLKLIFIVEIIQSSSLVGILFIETHYCSNELHARAVSDYIIIVRVSHSIKI